MKSRFILITTAAVLLAACDRNSALVDAQKTAEIAQQRQAEQAANDKIRALEDRLNEADRMKAAEREAELARVKEELAHVKQEKEQAAERIRDLQSNTNRPSPVAAPVAAPEPVAEAPRAVAQRADERRVLEEEEDRAPVYQGRVVPETQHVTSIQAFYEPLDRYGDWIQTDDYGYVFRPECAVTRRDWRPYTDGHWLHTDYGWTWQSNEDFGWATYHYGRWAREARAGWVWVPGREWGPGWVSWRRGNDYCGWAPLPPESRGRLSFTASVDRDYDVGPAAYVFLALAHFGAHSYAPVCERPEQNVNIINKTVNVTNITYNNTNNSTVVYNGGPSFDAVRARSKQPVENVAVSFASQAPASSLAKITNLREGNTLQVAAPPVPAAVAPLAPPKVKEKIGPAKVEKGWEGINPANVQKVREELATSSKEKKKTPLVAPVAVIAPVVKPAPVVAPPVSNDPPKPVALQPGDAKPKHQPEVLPRPENATLPQVPAPMPKSDVVAPPQPVDGVGKNRVREVTPTSELHEKPKAPEVLPKPEPLHVPEVAPEKPHKMKVQPPVDVPANPVENHPKVKAPKPERPAQSEPIQPKENPPAPQVVPEVKHKKQFAPEPQQPSQPQIQAEPKHKKEFVPPPQPVQPVQAQPKPFRMPEPQQGPIVPNDAERQREKAARKAAQAAQQPQRPPQQFAPPPQPQQAPQGQPSGDNSEKKKKKKENGQ